MKAYRNAAISAAKGFQLATNTAQTVNALQTDEGGFMLTDEGGIMQNDESEIE